MDDLKEPKIITPPPGALQDLSRKGTVYVLDPLGPPSASGHDKWHFDFITESINQLDGWNAEPIVIPPPVQECQENSCLLLNSRTDGRHWLATTAKRDDFAIKINAYASWLQAGRLFTLGNIPSPSTLIRSPKVTWDLATKENWAVWFDAAWPYVNRIGSVCKIPNLLVGDEAVWAFANPLDLVVQGRGLSPMGLANQIRSILASRQGPEPGWLPFSTVSFCVGLAWAESQTENTVWTEEWEKLCKAMSEIKQICWDEGYQISFVEPPHCRADLQTDITIRSYARHLVIESAKAVGLEVFPLAEGAWQEPEVPGVLSPRHTPTKGVGPSVKSRFWTPKRSKKK